MLSPPNRDHNLFLIGALDKHIYGNQLPSNLQVLKVLLFNIRELKLTLRKSAALVVSEVKIFWDKARLPVQHRPRCIAKVEALHKKWVILKNHTARPSNLAKEQIFASSLKNLFDISHRDALELVDDRSKQFLRNQRLEGRVGFIDELEDYYDKMNRERERKNEMQLGRQLKCESDLCSIDECGELSSDGGTDQAPSKKTICSHSNPSLNTANEDNDGPSAPKKPRANVNLLTENVVAVLDKCGVSNKDAVHLIAAIAEALNADLQSEVQKKNSIDKSDNKYAQPAQSVRKKT